MLRRVGVRTRAAAGEERQSCLPPIRRLIPSRGTAAVRLSNAAPDYRAVSILTHDFQLASPLRSRKISQLERFVTRNILRPQKRKTRFPTRELARPREGGNREPLPALHILVPRVKRRIQYI